MNETAPRAVCEFGRLVAERSGLRCSSIEEVLADELRRGRVVLGEGGRFELGHRHFTPSALTGPELLAWSEPRSSTPAPARRGRTALAGRSAGRGGGSRSCRRE